MCQRKIAYWVIPPEADAEFAAHMEEVLETYARPFDCDCPVLCMDEQPVQLIRETRTPMPATGNRPRRVDYEYERAGTASVFMFCEPLSGWRQATARPRRTKSDWAQEVAGLLEGRYAACSQVVSQGVVLGGNLESGARLAFLSDKRNPVKVITRSTDKVITDSRVSDHVPERSDAGIGL